jgi:hypothetical protein
MSEAIIAAFFIVFDVYFVTTVFYIVFDIYFAITVFDIDLVNTTRVGVSRGLKVGGLSIRKSSSRFLLAPRIHSSFIII